MIIVSEYCEYNGKYEMAAVLAEYMGENVFRYSYLNNRNNMV